MKSLIDTHCGESNALVNLSQNYGKREHRIPSSVRDSVIKHTSLADKFVEEFLTEKANSAYGHVSFSMKELQDCLVHPLSFEVSEDSQYSKNVPWHIAAEWIDEYTSNSKKRQTIERHVTVDDTTNSSILLSDCMSRFDQQKQAPSEIYENWLSEFFEETSSQDECAVARSSSSVLEDTWYRVTNVDEYCFEADNQFLSEEDNIQKGIDLFTAGNLPKAILHFEAAVQRNPCDAQAWYMVGLSQAENEQDFIAIPAFKRSLQADPTNLEAYLALSVCFANEFMEIDALRTLEQWINSNPSYNKYHYAVRNTAKSPTSNDDLFKKVEQQLVDAAIEHSDTVDPQLQIALGILYNLNGNYSKAIDSLNAALSVRSDDARLWNRLGATFANSKRFAEAVAAYRQALDLYPAYVRARYNLGISCFRLKCFRESIDHFILALELQQSSGSIDRSPVWNSLKSAVLRFQLPSAVNLLSAVESRDLPQLISLFHQLRTPPFD